MPLALADALDDSVSVDETLLDGVELRDADEELDDEPDDDCVGEGGALVVADADADCEPDALDDGVGDAVDETVDDRDDDALVDALKLAEVLDDCDAVDVPLSLEDDELDDEPDAD